MRVQLLLQKVHVYGGLLCFWYLIILGVSSLDFNHRFEFMEPKGDSIVWKYSGLKLDTNLQDIKLAEAIRDSVGLMGWPLSWEMWRKTPGLHFTMEQPAKRYFITYDFTLNEVTIREHYKGFWRVFNSLHGAGFVPNAPFTTVWQWYTRITVITVLLSIITGVYIWLKSRDGKKTGIVILFASVALSLIWMIQLYFRG